MRSPYQILGVRRDSTDAEIKARYRVLARRFHPDVSKDPGAEERFKEVSWAYDQIKDGESRNRYDIAREREKAAREARERAPGPARQSPTGSTASQPAGTQPRTVAPGSPLGQFLLRGLLGGAVDFVFEIMPELREHPETQQFINEFRKHGLNFTQPVDTGSRRKGNAKREDAR